MASFSFDNGGGCGIKIIIVEVLYQTNNYQQLSGDLMLGWYLERSLKRDRFQLTMDCNTRDCFCQQTANTGPVIALAQVSINLTESCLCFCCKWPTR
jgi:hypothetical protein